MSVLNQATLPTDAASSGTIPAAQKQQDQRRAARAPVQRGASARTSTHGCAGAPAQPASPGRRHEDGPDLAALRARDPQVVLTWIYAERPAVRAMLIRYGVPQHRLGEVVQEVMYQALRSLPRFKGHSRVKTWLLAVAKNVARSRHRRWKRRPTVSLATPQGKHYASTAASANATHTRTPHDAAVHSERKALVRRALQALPPHYAEVIRLRDLEERSTKEVAEALSTTRGNIRVRLYRARQALKGLLASYM